MYTLNTAGTRFTCLRVYTSDAALLRVTVAVSLPFDGVNDSVEAPFKAATQLGECRYKFLCRWAQYGSYSGTRDWEMNQYQAG